MAPLALMLRNRGFGVRGTDATGSPVVTKLLESGIEVGIGHSSLSPAEGEAVILTDAIDLRESPEVRRAQELDLGMFRRSQLLGWLLRDKKLIAVTGTHGKTTTTGLLGSALHAAGAEPGVVIGAESADFPGGVVEGSGEFVVVEACEAYDSLRDLDPFVVLLTNLEPDHLDFHGSWEGLKSHMLDFTCRIPANGALIACADDDGVNDLRLRDLPTRNHPPFAEIPYGLSPAHRSSLADQIPPLKLHGLHNRLNALGALAVCEFLKVDLDKAGAGLANFGGATRRLQILKDDNIAVVDDYAHHPTEIRASIRALRERYANRRLVVVFQPHLYSRTADFLPEFAAALSLADQVVLTDIYPAREDPIPGISSARIAELLTVPLQYVPSRHLLPRKVKELVKENDVIVGMGAGNIDAFAPSFLQELERNGKRVAVVFGGDSAEREISILSGNAVAEALESKGYSVTKYDITERLLTGQSLADLTGPDRPDAAFLCVHGTHAEDGAIQGFFELLNIPYTGSGIQTSAIAMDKARTKVCLHEVGLPTADTVLLARGEHFDPKALPCPAVVKPNAQGSTVGLSFVEKRSDLNDAIAKAFQYDEQVLIEPWLKGVEISVPVLGDRALPIVEIVPASGRYDFGAKYERGATEEIIPARISESAARKASEYAVLAHRLLGCNGATRTDMIVVGDRPVILEVNTIPGMTETSLLPNSAAAAGIGFADLCVWMIEEALQRRARNT
ncbi:MAG: UDP-N-acetylmuramate--L-alanine ligase [Fimbriimonadaceae bacterium]|nr:UDP-N-acetylmuramate--L-alanine ligase [Fimbriimonadaceae bacterium]